MEAGNAASGGGNGEKHSDREVVAYRNKKAMESGKVEEGLTFTFWW